MRNLLLIVFLFISLSAKAQLNCEEAVTHFIHDIQGSELTSPLTDRNVRVKGVVTGVFQGDDLLRGFFLQEELSDWDETPFTSEGIFVFQSEDSYTEVQAGDQVVVEATVVEFNDLTELTDVQVAVCQSGLTPDTTVIAEWSNDPNIAERYEGMLVRFTDTMTITGIRDLDRFGELVLSPSGRQWQYTELFPPSTDVGTYETERRTERLLLDDQKNGSDRRPILHLQANPGLRAGQQTTRLTGILSEAFGAYRLRPIGSVTFSGDNRLPFPPLDTGDLRIATFNVENYFNGNGSGGGFSTSRGADNQAEFEQQTRKLVPAILNLDAHIIGVQEVENDYPAGNRSSLAQLIAALNAAAPAGHTYAYVDPAERIGTDVIAVGIIYRSDIVTTTGDPQILDEPIELFQVDASNRAPLAQEFELNGRTFWVVSNHFKSKGTSGYDERPGVSPLDDDRADGQSYWNQTRTLASLAVADWMNTLTQNDPEPRVVILGDLNAYSQEDPLQVLEQAGYINALEDSYTIDFRGFWGMLDHILLSPPMKAGLLATTTVPINADESDIRNYQSEDPTYVDDSARRSADHDPVIAAFNLDATTSVRSVRHLTGIDVQVAPNPAKEVLQVTFTLAEDMVLYTSLYNIKGQRVRTIINHEKMPSGDHSKEVSLAGLTPGIYALRFQSNDRVLTKPVVIR
jgi:predicted extracellular nuclease